MVEIIYTTKPDFEATYIWKIKQDFKADLDVGLFDILTHKKPLYQKIEQAGGFREALGIPKNIKFMISASMKDAYLDRPIEEYLQVIDTIKPDFSTTMEVSLYAGHTGRLLKKLMEAYRDQLKEIKNRGYDLNKWILMLPARNAKEAEQNIQLPLNLGFTRFGLACSDPLKRDTNNAIANIREELNILKKFAQKTYLFGISSPPLIEYFLDADYIVSKGWFYKPMKLKKAITHNGSIRVNYPTISPNQWILNPAGGIRPPDIEAVKKIRQNMKQKITLQGIDNFNMKLEALKTQKKLEVKPWRINQVLELEPVTAWLHSLEVQEEKAIHA
jgi:hypothetical protein